MHCVLHESSDIERRGRRNPDRNDESRGIVDTLLQVTDN